MNKHIVTLSDTSHPFTVIQAETDNTDYVDNTELVYETTPDGYILHEWVETDNKDETVKWERTWQNDPKHNTEPETLTPTRTLPNVSIAEFAAIRAFKSKWGYVGNAAMTRELVGMLQNETTAPSVLINRFMRAWDLDGHGYDGIRRDLSDLFILRIVTENPTLAAESTIPTFTSDEVKALESLEGEKSDKWVTPGPSAQEQAEQAERVRKADKWVETDIWEKSTEKPLTLSEYNKAGKSTETLRKELFREEADKRVTRYFIGQTGWVWFVHHIIDMPEEYDTITTKGLYRAKDGRTTLHTTSLFMSEEKAWESINDDIRYNLRFDDTLLTHVVELDKM